MRIVRYRGRDGVSRWGLDMDGELRKVRGDIYGSYEPGPPVKGEVEWLAPWNGGKLVGVALNFPGIADQAVSDQYEPLVFLKGPNAVVQSGGTVRYPSVAVDEAWLEVEIAAVVRRRLSQASLDEARDAILGFTVANDITATNVYGRDHHLARAKCMDTFCPLGPAIVTDLDPSRARLLSRINGEMVQDSDVGQRIHDEAACVSAISRFMTLEPGDIVLTGTPLGTGPGTAGVFGPGDEIEVEVVGIGSVTNRVVATPVPAAGAGVETGNHSWRKT